MIVVSERPNPGTIDSCSVLVPNGCRSFGVEGAEAAEQLVVVAETMVDAHAELIELPGRCFDRRQILERGAARWQWHVLEKRDRDRIEPAGGNLVAGERRAHPGAGIVSGSQIAAKPAKLPDRTAAVGTENARVSDRRIRVPS